MPASVNSQISSNPGAGITDPGYSPIPASMVGHRENNDQAKMTNDEGMTKPEKAKRTGKSWSLEH
jgi:hypothetical protein